MQYNRKILIASKAHIPRMRTQNLVRDLNYRYIFDSNDQRDRAIRELGLHRNKTHVAHTPKIGQAGIAFVRDWAERNLTEPNEWYVWIDDNVSHFTWVPTPWYHYDKIDFDWDWNDPEGKNIMEKAGYDWHKVYATICSIDHIVQIWEELIGKCIDEKTVFGGLSIDENYFFRYRKWQYYTYVRTQNAVAKNVGLPFRYWPECMIEDMARSIDVVARYGKIVVDRFVHPVKQFWEEGGIGSLEERIPNLEYGNKILMRRYPGLLHYTKGRKYQLSFRFRTQKGIDNWRRKNGYLEGE